MLCANKNIRDLCFWLGEGKPERKFSKTCHITEENMKNELLDNIDHIGKYKTNNLYTRTDGNKDSNENQFKHIDIDIHVYKSDNLNSKSSSSSFSSDLHYKMFLLIIWSALMGLIIIYLN